MRLEAKVLDKLPVGSLRTEWMNMRGGLTELGEHLNSGSDKQYQRKNRQEPSLLNLKKASISHLLMGNSKDLQISIILQDTKMLISMREESFCRPAQWLQTRDNVSPSERTETVLHLEKGESVHIPVRMTTVRGPQE